MNTASNYGMPLPTSQGMVGANPRANAIAMQQNNASSQANANALMSGGKYKKKHRRGGSITVPQFPSRYPESAGAGTGTNAQISANSQTITQSNANSAFDSQATIKGGSKRRKTRRYRKGGNSNWNWNCKSGGKKRTKRNKKTRKY